MPLIKIACFIVTSPVHHIPQKIHQLQEGISVRHITVCIRYLGHQKSPTRQSQNLHRLRLLRPPRKPYIKIYMFFCNVVLILAKPNHSCMVESFQLSLSSPHATLFIYLSMDYFQVYDSNLPH